MRPTRSEQLRLNKLNKRKAESESQLPEFVQLELDFSDRLDPAAADALWGIVLGPGAAQRREPEATADGCPNPSAPPTPAESSGE